MKKSFYSNAEALLGKLNMASASDDNTQTLNVAAKIRNSLHNNGVHQVINQKEPNSWQFRIDPVEYIFENGKAVHCADYEHIAHALESSVNVLQKIFEHPGVVKIELIPDEYAMQKKIDM